MKRITLAFAHGNAGVADVVGHPVRQHGDFLHLGLFPLNELVYFLLGFRNGIEASVILVYLVEPKRFILPTGRAGHHQFRSGVEQVDHVGFPLEGSDIGGGEGVHLPSFLVAHGGGALALIELELQFLLHGHGHLVYLAHRGFRRPERYDVIELPAHWRDEPFLVITRRQQGVGETLLGDLVFHDVARLQATHFQHDLSGAPIDGPCRGRVIACLGDIEVDYVAVRPVDRGVAEFRVRRQGIVVVFDDPAVHGSFRCLYPKRLVEDESARAGGLYRHGGAIQQGHAVVACVSVFSVNRKER